MVALTVIGGIVLLIVLIAGAISVVRFLFPINNVGENDERV